jgi:ABC-type transport system involved in cytochrome bd biosynthesis fused ATPase/permease subunit
MGEIEKAQLIFLDSIERNQAEVARALQGQPEALRELIGAATSELRLAMLAVAEAIGKIPQPAKPDPPQSLMPVLEALGALANALVMQTNKVMAEMVRQADRLASPPPKKWRFNIDRNFQTGRIQEVTAEVVE